MNPVPAVSEVFTGKQGECDVKVGFVPVCPMRERNRMRGQVAGQPKHPEWIAVVGTVMRN